jgi:flavin-dependent dehydrogenase
MYAYTANPGFDGYHWHFGERAVAGIIPTNGGEACIFATIPTDRFDGMTQRDPAGRHAAILGEVAPALLAHITTNGCSRVRAFRGERSFVRQAHGPGWLLVGDAGLFRDPITSHGISDALRDAESAADAALTGSQSAFHDFEEERNALARPVIEATDAICAFNWTHDELKQHHKRFSLAMKAEVRTLAARAATARGEQASREQVPSASAPQSRFTTRRVQ